MLHNISQDIYLAPFILKYGDLLSLKSLCKVEFKEIGIRSEFRLFFKIQSKHNDLKIINKLKQVESNFFNSYLAKIENNIYTICLVFIIPDQYKSLVRIKHNSAKMCIDYKSIERLNSLLNNKAPATQSSRGFSCLIKNVVNIVIITSFFMEKLSFNILAFTTYTTRSILLEFVVHWSTK